jgi:hypothetical protein
VSGNIVPIQLRRLRRFVDRDAEMRDFCGMLNQTPSDQPVTVVWGDGGMGKSSLLDRMEEECSRRGMLQAKVVWSETRNHDYLAVMRKIRDDLGAEQFSSFNHLANFFTVPQYKAELVVSGSVSVGTNMQVQAGASIGSVTGIRIEDANFSIPREDLGIPEAERMARLTDVFLQDLNAATAARNVMLFFDACEKASAITQAWLSDRLVGALLEGRLDHLCIVLAGRTRPDWDNDRWGITNEMHLVPLGREHVIEYVTKSQLKMSQAEIRIVAETLLAATNGVPSSLANAVNTLAKQWQARAA